MRKAPPPTIPRVSELPWPANWPALFGSDDAGSAAAPLTLEIGFGDGRFLAFLAKRNPRQPVLGLEISHRSLAKAGRLLALYDHLRVLHGTAELALGQLFRPGELAEAHINFPDPWFKRRQGRRRLLHGGALAALLNRLAAGALLYLATDIRPYAEAWHERLSQQPALENALSAPWATARPLGPATKYERLARAAGRQCYYFAYRRNEIAAPPPPRIEEGPMPHIVIETPLSLAETQRRFADLKPKQRALDGTAGGIHLHFLAIYGGEEALLCEVFIREGPLSQRVALQLALQRAGPQTAAMDSAAGALPVAGQQLVAAAGGHARYTLSLSGIGHPRATPGIQLALATLGRWLLSLHPAARLIHQRVRGWQETAAPG